MKELIEIEGSKVIKEHWLINDLNYFNLTTRSEGIKHRFPGCYYPPAHENTLGCSMGKRLTPEQQEQWEKTGDTVKYIYKSEAALSGHIDIPKWVNDDTVNFLSAMQDLHDRTECWNENGISKQGKERVRKIIIVHNLDMSILKQHINWL